MKRLGYVIAMAVSAAPLVVLLAYAERHGALANDFVDAYLPAAHAVLHGDSPFQAHPVGPFRFIYAPLAAFVFVPLTVFSTGVAAVVWSVTVLACAPATLWVLGVRDWGCYAVILLWLPVFSAVQTGNLSLPIALGIALLWRYRARAGMVVPIVGVLVALKLFLFPLLVFTLVAYGRRAAAAALALVATLVLVPWAAIGFAGFSDYPTLVSAAGRAERAHSFTVQALVGPAFGWHAAAAAAFLLGGSLIVVAYRACDLRLALFLLIGASLAMTPTVSVHYFVLLLPVVAIASPRFGRLWLVPVGMFVLGVWASNAVFAAIGVAFAAAILLTSARTQTTPAENRVAAPCGLIPPPEPPSTKTGVQRRAVLRQG
jgi:hypothetical protein